MKNLGYWSIFCSLVGTTVLYLLSKPSLNNLTISPLLTASQYFSLIGTVLLAYSYILATRLKTTEVLFGGLDRVYKAHHMISGVAYILLLYHPVFLVIKTLPNVGASLKYIVPGFSVAYTSGILALALLTCLLILTFFVNLPYDVWKKTHEFMGFVILAGALHVFLIPSDVSRYVPLRAWMLMWLGLGIAAFVYKKYLYDRMGKVYLYTLMNRKRSGDIMDLELAPAGKAMYFQPGQFAFFSVQGNDTISNEEHPYSLACHPNEGKLRLGIKIAGDHTLAMKDLPLGSILKVKGPYGMFGERVYTKKPVVLIGAGIGATPILPLVHEAALKRRNDTFVFYLTKNEEEAYYHQEFLHKASGNDKVRYVNYNSGVLGRFDIKYLQSVVPELKDALVFMCGPNKMMESVSSQLKHFGLRNNQIIFEDFNFK